jgi:hypothetical protein
MKISEMQTYVLKISGNRKGGTAPGEKRIFAFYSPKRILNLDWSAVKRQKEELQYSL